MADVPRQANSPRKASSGKPTFCAPAKLDQVLLRSAGTGQAEIIAFLCSPEAWPDIPEAVELVETHMALLFFAGDQVYKMKRAVQLKHMDMRLLETRVTFCRREVELNRQLAPDVYLGTVHVTREADGTLAIGGAGELLEPLVIMRRLDVQQGLDQRILHGGVTSEEIDSLSKLLGGFYARQPPACIGAQDFVVLWQEMVGRVRATLMDPQFGLDRYLVDPPLNLMEGFLKTHSDVLRDLVKQGRIVDGHGDLKPEHIVMGPRLLVIDRIEFDDRLRIADPFSEMAFLGLECERLGAAWIGPRLMAGLADRLGSGRPQSLMQFYRCYEACLRARLSIEHLLDETPRTPGRWPVQTHDYLQRAIPAAQS